jgi:glutamate synthase domain-containing protein 2/glutamate synthase domain-containing protein 1/glutamate synthase domain-containing protein 3
MVADVQGRPSHNIVTLGLSALARLEHRGAVGSDPLTGDGAGVLTQIPHRLFADEHRPGGRALPSPGDYAVAMVFLPHDPWSHPPRKSLVERVIAAEGLEHLGWRDVPVDESVCGPLALESAPYVAQLFVGRGALDRERFERRLYLTRKRIEREGAAQGMQGGEPFYICSFSTRTIVYKGLLLPDRLARFYADLADRRYESAVAVVHQRFSTNTFPSWERAHPYRLLAHNGEINTLRGNVAWMGARERALPPAQRRLVSPVLTEGGSDSAMLDNALELLQYSGRSLAHSVAMTIPEAWQKDPAMPPERRAFYEYHASLMEPWDGPACVAFTDGRVAGAVLDRNGLRPARWLLTTDGMLVMASEAGVVDVPPERVARRDRLRPGRMLLVDLEQGRLVSDDEVKSALASRRPYAEWLASDLIRIRDIATPSFATLPRPMPEHHLEIAQRVFGYTREDLAMLVAPMAVTGKEPVGSMGDDTPLAVLSDQPELLFNYFKQLFAQVTNPPIDPLREDFVMSLRTTLGPSGSLLEEGPEHCHQLELDSPVLTNARLRQIRAIDRGELKARTLDAHFEAHRGAEGLRRAVADLAGAAENAVRDGITIVILTDRGHDASRVPIPSLLAVSAVHHRLIEVGLRHLAAIVVETGEAREVMHVALLVGYGAGAVNPYLAYETIAALSRRGDADVDAQTGIEQYIKAVQLGLLKIMSKMGISTLQSYRGAQLFEALGLARELIDTYFPGTVSRIEGARLEEIVAESLARHTDGYAERRGDLPTGGRYKWRRDGQRHAYDPNTVGLLQHAARSGSYRLFKRYTRMVDEQSQANTSLRSLLELCEGPPIPLEEVEPASEIVQRFRTGAMSFGSISREAHETLAIAMNRLGAKSNSGEGGEDPARFVPDADGNMRRSAVKQVASGRFGVTPAYLADADELQIKVAQGAKPGEGGQLPGHKVDAVIAQIRCSTPGVGLISPPPHHDIYSIEDLAQLIYDLRAANSRARISVKLVSEVGVGTIAAGVVKAGADHVLISGASGGTGASPLSSIKHAGVPWELGLAETQQVLVMNDLRGRVVLETDGQLKTGRDVVVAALLGAEAFGFGTAALVSAGCVLMRVCHLNTCPVGVATQDPALRARFRGEPQHVVNFMSFIAEEVREILARLGARRLGEVVGRVELLRPRRTGLSAKASRIDLAPLLHHVASSRATLRQSEAPRSRPALTPLDTAVLEGAAPALESGKPVDLQQRISNSDRSFGTRLSAAIVQAHGPDGLPDYTVRVHTVGSSGQSYGAFLAGGVDLRLEGEANDALGKGMAGGRIVVVPFSGSRPESHDDILVGNVALYGATGGSVFIKGVAGERFAVRNSGASAVVEGVGAHGCEYMTRGTVVVLGEVGPNFAAGMSGGVAYVAEHLDLDRRTNHAMVELLGLETEDLEALRELLEAHVGHTGSRRATEALARLDRSEPPGFVRVMPREYRRVLEAGVARPRLRVVHG